MSIRYSKILWVFFLVAVLSLVACGGQAVKPSDVSVEQINAMDRAAEKVLVTDDAKLTAEVELVKQPEPPVVEVTPRKQMDESQIAVEAIPAKEALLVEQVPLVSETSPVTDSAIVDQMEESDGMGVTTMESVVPETVSADSQQVETSTVAKSDSEESSALSMSSDPNHFKVTVGAKQAGHPSYGKGHPLGFLIDGIPGKELVVERGQTYTFDILTNPKHDVYLSRKAIGWGSAPYSAGVEGAYTYKGTMTFKPDKDSPSQLFYACRNHPYMGGIIHVVNLGEEKVEIKQRVVMPADAGLPQLVVQPVVTASKVKQKLMFAEMMANAQGAKRVMASQNVEAKQMVVKAKKLMGEARKKSLVGALPEALSMADQVLKMLSEATRLVPGEEEMAQLTENYKTLLAEIKDYQKSYRSNVKSLRKQGALDESIAFDEKKFEGVIVEAATLAGQKNYVRANKLLQQAQVAVTVALHKMLDSKTLVYDLNFETAADEYEYELKRFVSYEELIPIAIEAKKPSAGAVKLMKSFLKKARKRRDEAQDKAEASDYPSAIGMMLQATKTVRRALRMVGVTQ